MFILIAFLVFIVIAVCVFVAFGLFDLRTAQARIIKQRLASVDQAVARQPSEDLALLRDEMLSAIPTLHRLLSRSQRMSSFQSWLAQGALQIRAGKFLLAAGCFAVIAGSITNLLTRGWIFAVLAAACAAAGPFIYAGIQRSRRFHQFEQLFPQAIDLLARAVRAGHSFNTALELIGDELAEPVGGEFRKLFEEQKFGIPMRDALLNLAERVPLVDVKFFVTSVMLQRETGGNLAEILDKLSYVIRERFKILRQVQVFTAQGRMSMRILMALPPALVVIMSIMNPSLMRVLFTDPLGHLLIGLGVIMQGSGYLLMRKVIHIEV
jgi:tight adherence protein B